MDIRDELNITPNELERLTAIASRGGRDGQTAGVILSLHDGEPVKEVAAKFGVTAPTVRNWAGKFVADRLGGIRSKRKGRPRLSIPAPTKKCSRCKAVKPISEFHPRSSSVTPRTSADISNECKPCNVVTTREKGYAKQMAKLGRDGMRRQVIAEIAQLTEKLTWIESQPDPE